MMAEQQLSSFEVRVRNEVTSRATAEVKIQVETIRESLQRERNKQVQEAMDKLAKEVDVAVQREKDAVKKAVAGRQAAETRAMQALDASEQLMAQIKSLQEEERKHTEAMNQQCALAEAEAEQHKRRERDLLFRLQREEALRAKLQSVHEDEVRTSRGNLEITLILPQRRSSATDYQKYHKRKTELMQTQQRQRNLPYEAPFAFLKNLLLPPSTSPSCLLSS